MQQDVIQPYAKFPEAVQLVEADLVVAADSIIRGESGPEPATMFLLLLKAHSETVKVALSTRKLTLTFSLLTSV